ncbi:MAG: DUF393 domain-containing protein [Calditrichaeota bacterium]|nr:DUF393 domain-containing protein [Calditrichota bacterium]
MASPYIVVFDGCCNLCEGWVQFVIRRDTKRIFQFVPAQSPEGEALLQRCGIPPDRLETLILLKHQQLFTRSDAVLEILRHLKGRWKWLFWLKIIPRPFRDWIYKCISRHRYRWFGRKVDCAIPRGNRPDHFPLPPYA